MKGPPLLGPLRGDTLSKGGKYAELQHLCVEIKVSQRVNATAVTAALRVSVTGDNDDVVL